MSSEVRYSLTRLCIRSGQMTLPFKMLELFPQEGEIKAVDTTSGKEYLLQVVQPRRVTGLDEFFAAHELDVNDEIAVRVLEDGRYGFTPLAKAQRRARSEEEASKRLLDRLLELGTPLSEAEIRSLEPALHAEFDVAALLEADGRFQRYGGRWALRSQERPSEASAEHGQRQESDESSVEAGHGEHDAGSEDRAGEDAGGGSDEERHGGDPGGAKPPRWVVTPYQHVDSPAPAGLNSASEQADVELQSRARQVLLAFGFKVEGLPRGQFMAAAEMGRKAYSVLVQLYPERSRLDWAALLSKRRDSGAAYLAVFGPERELIRLSAPAEMARATLWPWESLDRVGELVRSVPVSPFDVEPFFQQGGLLENGLKRFEQTIGKRIAERGAFSSVLTRLAAFKAPAVFMLDDVVDEGDLSREQALRVLELLSQPPFHMIVKVDDGEFCIRYNVAQGLAQLSDYALSLRQRLPERRTERLRANAEANEGLAVRLAEEPESTDTVESNGRY